MSTGAHWCDKSVSCVIDMSNGAGIIYISKLKGCFLTIETS